MARPVGSPGVRRNRGTNDSVDVDQAHPDRSTRPIGVSARKHRLEEFKILASNRYRRAGYSREETAKRVAEDFSNELVTNREFLKWWDRFEPRSRAAPGRDVNRLVEVAAVLRLPEMAWLRKYLETHEGSGRKAATLPIATLFSMALEGGMPEVLRTSDRFRHSDATRAWAYDYPTCAKRSATFSSLHDALNRRNPDAILHVQIALTKRLARLIDRPDVSKAPLVGEYLVVDGTQQQADVRQVFPVNKEHAEFLHGPYEDLGFVRHVRHDGSELKRNHGHNIVVISDLATTLPLVYAPYPAQMDERKATRQLLEVLFRIWPECPARYLVGDSLYDHSDQFARDLENHWGIHPVFVPHGSRPRGRSENDEIDGVPFCAHGLMKRSKDDDFEVGLKRVRKGIPRGVDVGHRKARIRWSCVADICAHRTTRPHDDPRRHRYVPLAGDHSLRFMGGVLFCRRNGIESIFALMKMGGYFGPGGMRTKWAKTFKESCWAYMLPLLGLTAKRVAHESGLYRDVHEKATLLSLLTPPTVEEPTPGPDPLSLAAYRERLPIDPISPETWKATQ